MSLVKVCCRWYSLLLFTVCQIRSSLACSRQIFWFQVQAQWTRMHTSDYWHATCSVKQEQLRRFNGCSAGEARLFTARSNCTLPEIRDGIASAYLRPSAKCIGKHTSHPLNSVRLQRAWIEHIVPWRAKWQYNHTIVYHKVTYITDNFTHRRLRASHQDS